ncbi:MAG: hypothetical protein J7501_17260, partial [Bdellovibrio sp.]|nr:hypothetical protein [Bdellovibrio sp.]
MSIASTLLLVLAPLLGFAQEKPSDLVVTKEEQALYLQNNQTVISTASRCIEQTYDTHIKFFKKYGISKYYGDRNPNLVTRFQSSLALARCL